MPSHAKGFAGQRWALAGQACFMRTLVIPASPSPPSYRPTCPCGSLPTFQSPPAHCATVPLGPICSLASRQAWHAGGCRPRGVGPCRFSQDPPQGVRPFRLFQDPPRGYVHSGCPRTPPQGVRPGTLPQDLPGQSFYGWEILGFSTMVLSRERECGMSPGSHSDFVCKLAHCMLYLGRNLALLNCQCQECINVDISGMPWSQTV